MNRTARAIGLSFAAMLTLLLSAAPADASPAAIRPHTSATSTPSPPSPSSTSSAPSMGDMPGMPGMKAGGGQTGTGLTMPSPTGGRRPWGHLAVLSGFAVLNVGVLIVAAVLRRRRPQRPTPARGSAGRPRESTLITRKQSS